MQLHTHNKNLLIQLNFYLSQVIVSFLVNGPGPGPGPGPGAEPKLVPVPVPPYIWSWPWSRSWSRHNSGPGPGHNLWSRHTVSPLLTTVILGPMKLLFLAIFILQNFNFSGGKYMQNWWDQEESRIKKIQLLELCWHTVTYYFGSRARKALPCSIKSRPIGQPFSKKMRNCLLFCFQIFSKMQKVKKKYMRNW